MTRPAWSGVPLHIKTPPHAMNADASPRAHPGEARVSQGSRRAKRNASRVSYRKVLWALAITMVFVLVVVVCLYNHPSFVPVVSIGSLAVLGVSMLSVRAL